MKEKGDVEWIVKTGDWFWYDNSHHTVLQVDGQGDDALLHGQRDRKYKKSEVVPLHRRVDCREWLMEHNYDFYTDNESPGSVTVTARKRETEFTISRTEPTELAAIYSIMIEIGEMMHMGTWG